jgi:hypothetical protein
MSKCSVRTKARQRRRPVYFGNTGRVVAQNAAR